MSSAKSIFNSKKFYEILVSSQNIAQKLTWQYVLMILASQYMFSAITVLHDVLSSAKELPLTKYNALFAVYNLITTATYISISFLQIYILPLLRSVTVIDMTKRSDDELERFFVDMGFRQTLAIRIIGRKFVSLAAQIVFSLSVIRPYQNILHNELEIDSFAKKNYQELRKKYRKQQQRQANLDLSILRKKYKKDLQIFNPSKLASFLGKTLRQQIVFNQGIGGSLRKLIESEDCFISIPIINTCISLLSNITQDFTHKRHYLNLFSLYIKQGNIYAIIAAHNAGFIKTLFNQVKKVPGHRGLEYGKMIFPEVQGSDKEKYEFYCQFLRQLNLWAICLPKNQISQTSQIKKMYDYLRKKQGFQFPQIVMLDIIVSDFAQNLSKRQRQNDEILRIMDEDSHFLSQMESVKLQSDISEKSNKSNKSNKNKQGTVLKQMPLDSIYPIKDIKSLKKQTDQPQQGDSVDDILDEVQANLNRVQYKQLIPETIKKLRQFRDQWDILQEVYGKDMPIEVKSRGDKYLAQIKAIDKVHDQMENNDMSFRIFNQKVNLILHPGQVTISMDVTKQQINFAGFHDKKEEIKQPKVQAAKLLKFNQFDTGNDNILDEFELQFESKYNQSQKAKSDPSAESQTSKLSAYKQSLKKKSDNFKQQQQSNRQQKISQKLASQQKNQKYEKGYSFVKQLSSKVSSNPILKSIRESIITESLTPKKQQIAKQQFNVKKTTINKFTQKKIMNQQYIYQNIDQKGIKMEAEPNNQYGIMGLLKKRKQFITSPQEQDRRRDALQSKILPSELVNEQQNNSRIFQSQNIQDRVIFQDTYTNNQTSQYHQNFMIKSKLNKRVNRSVISSRSKRSSNFNQGKKSIRFDDYQDKNLSNNRKVKKDSQKALDGSMISEIESSSSVLKQKKSIKKSSHNKSSASASNIEEKIISKQHSQNHISAEFYPESQAANSLQQENIPSKILQNKKSQQIEQPKDIKQGIINNCQPIPVRQYIEDQTRQKKKSQININRLIQSPQPRVKGFSRKNGMTFQKMIHQLTKRSIQNYRYSVKSSSSKNTSLSRNTSADASGSINRTIIKRQYQKIKQDSRRQYGNNSRSRNTFTTQSSPIVPSECSNQNYDSYELVTNKLLSFFPNKQSSKVVKNYLQNKGVLYDSSLIQVGYVHFQKKSQLDFTIFLTAKKNISSVNISIDSDDKLNIHLQADQIKNMSEGKQEVIKISTSLIKFPYKMPILKLSFRQKKSNQYYQMMITIPCSINKYTIFKSVSQDRISQWMISQKMTRYRSYGFKMLKKLEKNEYLQKYLPFLSLTRGRGGMRYITEYCFGEKKGLLQLVQEDKGWILAAHTEGKQCNLTKYLLSTLFFLLAD